MYTYISAFRHIPVFIWHSVHLRWMLFGNRPFHNSTSDQPQVTTKIMDGQNRVISCLGPASYIIPCICNWFDRSQLVDLGWNAFRIQPSKKRRWYHQSPPTTSRQGLKKCGARNQISKISLVEKNQENSRGNFTVFPGNVESPCYIMLPLPLPSQTTTAEIWNSAKIPKADATCSEKGVGSIEPASQFDTSLHFPKRCCEIDLELGGILCIISLEAYWG